MATKSVTMPVTGMSCASCAHNIERTVGKLPGVGEVNVNFAAEQAVISFDSEQLDVQNLVDGIKGAGYGVAIAHTELPITGMTCASCAANIERALNRKLPGVIKAEVNFATERARVDYLPGLVEVSDIVSAVEKAGYGAFAADDAPDAADAEQAARDAEIHDQTRKFIVGVIFATPLFFLSMARDFGFAGPWIHGPWVNWMFFLLATPVQFYTGWDYYTGGFKSVRNGSANMDVLIALGSSVAYFYSLGVILLPGMGAHVYFETSAVIITSMNSEYQKSVSEKPLAADCCSGHSGQEARPAIGALDEHFLDHTRATFTVHGMTCGGCAKRIKDAVKNLTGIFNASVDFKTRQATIDFDPERLDYQSIRNVISAAGYTIEGDGDADATVKKKTVTAKDFHLKPYTYGLLAGIGHYRILPGVDYADLGLGQCPVSVC